jgi:hypothetical protein
MGRAAQHMIGGLTSIMDVERKLILIISPAVTSGIVAPFSHFIDGLLLGCASQYARRRFDQERWEIFVRKARLEYWQRALRCKKSQPCASALCRGLLPCTKGNIDSTPFVWCGMEERCLGRV